MTEPQEPQDERPSFRDLAPLDFGGGNARRGFAYQDHIAASYCLDLLDEDGPAEVWCETLDDILLFRSSELEYVQAKTTTFPEWTMARACSREGGRKGTSIVERSLTRDRARERATFTIVTPRGVHLDLRPLRRIRTERHQTDVREALDTLAQKLVEKLGEACASANGNDLRYWTHNCHWNADHTEAAVQSMNVLRILKLAESEGWVVTVDQVEEIYRRLLRKVYDAARADYRMNPPAKCVTEDAMRAWLTGEFTRASGTWHSRPGVNLEEKFAQAGLPLNELEGAADLRTRYRTERLNPRYLDGRDFVDLEAEIDAELRVLRSRVDAEIESDIGPLLHSKSLECAREVTTRFRSKHVPVHIGQGFMYELADRCTHRFRRAGST